MTFEQAVDEQLARMRELIISRQRKYGAVNIEAGGVHGLITRIQDKLARIKQDHPGLVCGQGPCVERTLSDEASSGAWLDLANYAGPIAMMLRHGTWGMPLEE